jgi:hypothetical protein
MFSLLIPFTLAAQLAHGAPLAGPVAAAAPALATTGPATAAELPSRAARGERAQRLVASLLVDADSVDLVAADRAHVRFVLERAGLAYHLDLALGEGGRLEAATLRRAAPAELGEGELSWLGLAIGDREGVRAAAVGDDGVVVLQLDDGTALPLTPEAGDDYVGC